MIVWWYNIRMSHKCLCGCGADVSLSRSFVSGHNLRGLERTQVHRRRISEGQRRAWLTKRVRKPIGSKWVDTSGYIRVKVVAGKGNWKLEHVMVIERVIGRPLRRGEIVHHINGDRQDNRAENLYLCRDHSHHNEVHRSEAAALRALLAVGLVTFRDGRYEAVLRSS